MQHLVSVAEVIWRSTWEDTANAGLAPVLVIEPLDALREPADCPWPWKPVVASLYAAAALAGGREVFWIEDFYGAVPTLSSSAGVVFIDTAATNRPCVLICDMLPPALRPPGLPA